MDEERRVDEAVAACADRLIYRLKHPITKGRAQAARRTKSVCHLMDIPESGNLISSVDYFYLHIWTIFR